MRAALALLSLVLLAGCESGPPRPPCYRVACNAINVPGTACGVFRTDRSVPVAIYPTGEEAITFAKRNGLPFCEGVP